MLLAKRRSGYRWPATAFPFSELLRSNKNRVREVPVVDTDEKSCQEEMHRRSLRYLLPSDWSITFSQLLPWHVHGCVIGTTIANIEMGEKPHHTTPEMVQLTRSS